MKYLKTYEDSITDNNTFELDYDLTPDDYVLVYLGDVNIDISSIPPDVPTLDDLPQDEVENKYSPVQIVSYEGDNEYSCRFTNGVVFMVYSHEIIRYLTDEEINEYEMKINSIRYNL